MEKIKNFNDFLNEKNDWRDKDKLADREGFFSWYLEDELEPLSESELASIKYNL